MNERVQPKQAGEQANVSRGLFLYRGCHLGPSVGASDERHQISDCFLTSASFTLDPLGRLDPDTGQDYQGRTMVFDRFHLRQAERTFGARSEFLRLLIHPTSSSATVSLALPQRA